MQRRHEGAVPLLFAPLCMGLDIVSVSLQRHKVAEGELDTDRQ
jgi:hypothetical protein